MVLIYCGVVSFYSYGKESTEPNPRIITILDTLSSSYYNYSSVEFEDQAPRPEENAQERHDYDLRLPIPLDLDEKTKIILYGQAKYNFLDSHDPYNRGGIQELALNLLRKYDSYTLMLTSGMVKKDYDQHVLSYMVSRVFVDNYNLFATDLYLKSVLFRVRNINGRHDYVVVLYMVSDLGNQWQLNISIPSEFSLTKDFNDSLFKFGLRIDGLENLMDIDDSNYWLIGYRAYGFIRYAHKILDPIWASIELGSSFEQYEVFDNKAKQVGLRKAWASSYGLLSLGVRFN